MADMDVERALALTMVFAPGDGQGPAALHVLAAEVDRRGAALAERDAEVERLRALVSVSEELQRCWRDRTMTADYPVVDARIGRDLARALAEHRRVLRALTSTESEAPPAPATHTSTVTYSATCPTLCDDDCEVPCHEAHAVKWKRDHEPDECAAAPEGEAPRG